MQAYYKSGGNLDFAFGILLHALPNAYSRNILKSRLFPIELQLHLCSPAENKYAV